MRVTPRGELKHPAEYEVHRETKCKYVIHNDHTEGEKFISKTGKKRFAYPTKEEALVSYKARKRAQIKILKNQISNAENGLYNVGESVKTALAPRPGFDDVLDVIF